MENMNNFQGKRPDQYKNSEKFAGYGILGIIILLIIMTLLGGCATTQPTKKCCDKEKECNIISKPGDVASNLKWGDLKPISNGNRFKRSN